MPPRNNRGKVASPQDSSQPKFDPSAWLLRRVTDVDDDTVASQHDLRQKVRTHQLASLSLSLSFSLPDGVLTPIYPAALTFPKSAVARSVLV